MLPTLGAPVQQANSYVQEVPPYAEIATDFDLNVVLALQYLLEGSYTYAVGMANLCSLQLDPKEVVQASSTRYTAFRCRTVVVVFVFVYALIVKKWLKS